MRKIGDRKKDRNFLDFDFPFSRIELIYLDLQILHHSHKILDSKNKTSLYRTRKRKRTIIDDSLETKRSTNEGSLVT